MKEIVYVIAGIIEREGRFLIGRRIKGRLKGKWEFLGGKLKDGETVKLVNNGISNFGFVSRVRNSNISIEITKECTE